MVGLDIGIRKGGARIIPPFLMMWMVVPLTDIGDTGGGQG